jgi:ABC-type multidrug transport system fused ATPase/permease subunit
MINNAWQSLNGLLNSFTRAAGAAERVLALVDLEPDIPPAGGISAEDIPEWSIAVKDVHFR